MCLSSLYESNLTKGTGGVFESSTWETSTSLGFECSIPEFFSPETAVDAILKTDIAVGHNETEERNDQTKIG